MKMVDNTKNNSLVEKRKFGDTGLTLSCIGFGGAAISGEGGGYGFGAMDEKAALELLAASLERGINFYDTAPIYGYGLSEQRIGKAFKNNRQQVFIASKGGVTWHENRRVNHSNHPQVIKKMIEQSLQDLQTDYIDLYQIHWPDSKVDIRHTMDVLKKFQDEGKIHHLGLCNMKEEDILKAKEVAPISSLQNQMNMFHYQENLSLFPFLEKEQISFFAWGTLDKGILSGRVNADKRKFDSLDVRSWAPWWKKEDKKWKFELIEVIKNLLNELHAEYSLLEISLAFNLQFKTMTSTLCGIKSLQQLDSMLKAFHHLPSPELLSTIQEKVIAFHQEKRSS